MLFTFGLRKRENAHENHGRCEDELYGGTEEASGLFGVLQRLVDEVILALHYRKQNLKTLLDTYALGGVSKQLLTNTSVR